MADRNEDNPEERIPDAEAAEGDMEAIERLAAEGEAARGENPEPEPMSEAQRAETPEEPSIPEKPTETPSAGAPEGLPEVIPPPPPSKPLPPPKASTRPSEGLPPPVTLVAPSPVMPQEPPVVEPAPAPLPETPPQQSEPPPPPAMRRSDEFGRVYTLPQAGRAAAPSLAGTDDLRAIRIAVEELLRIARDRDVGLPEKVIQEVGATLEPESTPVNVKDARETLDRASREIVDLVNDMASMVDTLDLAIRRVRAGFHRLRL